MDLIASDRCGLQRIPTRTMGVFVIIYVSEEDRVNKAINQLGRFYQEKFVYSTMDHEKTVGLVHFLFLASHAMYKLESFVFWVLSGKEWLLMGLSKFNSLSVGGASSCLSHHCFLGENSRRL